MENENDPIGGPQPVESGQFERLLGGICTVVAVTLGTLVVLPFFLSPRRLQGATCSAKLKWQERQRELQQTIVASPNSPAVPARPIEPNKPALDP